MGEVVRCGLIALLADHSNDIATLVGDGLKHRLRRGGSIEIKGWNPV